MQKISIDFKNKQQVMLLAILISIAVLYVYLAFLLLPQIRDAFDKYSKAKKARLDVGGYELDISKIDGLKKEAQLYRSKIDSYERMLPAEQEVPKLLEDLSEMAKRSGVKIVGITPVQSKDASTAGRIYQEIPILINAKSGYHELGKFLSDLEGSARFMKVANIKIKANLTSPKKHDVELTVMTYTLSKGG